MARKMIDYGYDDDNDLDIAGGDFAREESTRQHQRQMLLNVKGDYKQSPLTCVGAVLFLDDSNQSGLFREISQQYTGDGMDVQFVGKENGQLKVRAEYK